MPRPLPDYVRSPVREIILTKFPDGLSGVATKVGCSYTGVIKILTDSKSVALESFLSLAEQLPLKPAILLEIFEVEPTARREWLLKKLKSKGDINSLKIDGRARSYLYAILSGKAAHNIPKTYKPLADAFSMTLPELRDYLRESR